MQRTWNVSVTLGIDADTPEQAREIAMLVCGQSPVSGKECGGRFTDFVVHEAVLDPEIEPELRLSRNS